MAEYKIEFYIKEDGSVPVEQFLDSIDMKMKAKIFRVFSILENNGPQIRMLYSEYLGDGIFEIRTKQGSDITRILYFFYVRKQIILTNGFVKKTQRTPKAEIELAKKYRDDYIRRCANEQI